jgi:signal transduction histidine kinase
MADRRPRTDPNLKFDAAIAVALAALAIVTVFVFTDQLEDYGTEPDWFAVVLIMLQTVPLVLRRRFPATVLGIVVGAFMLDRLIEYPSTEATFGIAFALHAVGSDLMPRRRSTLVGWSGVAAVTGFTGLGVLVGDVPGITMVVMGALSTAAFLLGREVHARRAYQLALERRAEQLLRERETRAREAVLAERARIARELHDVVAHEMTVMTIQAEAAQRVLDTSPEDAMQALRAIEGAGREGLTEMRRLIHFLRTEAEHAGRTPQPALARLPELASQMTDAGLAVTLRVEGDPVTLPPGLELNAYRIIQESLTNTLKHGGPDASATVTVEYLPDGLGVEIVDDGRGAAEALVTADGTGQGLVGMRQRVALFDGTLTAGPIPGGGYRVAAALPSPPP